LPAKASLDLISRSLTATPSAHPAEDDPSDLDRRRLHRLARAEAPLIATRSAPGSAFAAARTIPGVSLAPAVDGPRELGGTDSRGRPRERKGAHRRPPLGRARTDQPMRRRARGERWAAY
jgi:hypothetical protein